MPRLALLVLTALVTAGCLSAGYAGRNPGYISCKGKGAITGTGTLALGAGAGGASTNNFTIQADCGDGFVYQQGKTPVPVPLKP